MRYLLLMAFLFTTPAGASCITTHLSDISLTACPDGSTATVIDIGTLRLHTYTPGITRHYGYPAVPAYRYTVPGYTAPGYGYGLGYSPKIAIPALKLPVIAPFPGYTYPRHYHPLW